MGNHLPIGSCLDNIQVNSEQILKVRIRWININSDKNRLVGMESHSPDEDEKKKVKME